MGDYVAKKPKLSPVVTLFGGTSDVNLGDQQQFIGTDGQTFTYTPSASTTDSDYIGVFLGLVLPFSNQSFSIQTGAEYVGFNHFKTTGQHTVGIEPATSTLYSYQYNTQIQQILGTIKLFLAPEWFQVVNHHFYPYFSIGLGAAFNEAYDFRLSTSETGSINVAPTYRDRTSTSFSYTLGAGLDASLTQHIRVGVGYRFSDFGKFQFSDGDIAINNVSFLIPFNLSTSNLYANQFLARVTYIV